MLESVRAGEALVCFCVGITQTRRSDHHTHWGDSAYTQYRKPAVWVTGTTLIDWHSAVAFRQSCASAGRHAYTHEQSNTDTHTHTHLHSWYCGFVWRGSLWGVGPGWTVGTKARVRPQVQKRTKQEVWGNNNTHRVMDPLYYSFVYHACGSVGFVQNVDCVCVYKRCVRALYSTRVDMSACVQPCIRPCVWLLLPSYAHLLSRLCVSMNGCASVVYLLMALSLSSSLHLFSMSDIQKKKVDSDLSYCCSNSWSLSNVTVKVIHFISEWCLYNVPIGKSS